jgi:hypothetical protein
MAVIRDPAPLPNHRARLSQYLSTIAFPVTTVAGRIIEERRPADDARDPIRPRLVLWACDALGGDLADAVPVAAAFDLFERFLVLHGELTQDASAAGRWGLGQNLNAGDALYALAFRCLASDVKNVALRLQTAQLVARAVLEAIENEGAAGEAVLTGAALRAGAVLAGVNDEVSRCFAQSGRLLATDPSSAAQPLRSCLGEEELAAFEGVARYLARRVA